MGFPSFLTLFMWAQSSSVRKSIAGPWFSGWNERQRFHLIFSHLVSLAKSLHKTCIGHTAMHTLHTVAQAYEIWLMGIWKSRIRRDSIWHWFVWWFGATYDGTINTQLNTKPRRLHRKCQPLDSTCTKHTHTHTLLLGVGARGLHCTHINKTARRKEKWTPKLYLHVRNNCVWCLLCKY